MNKIYVVNKSNHAPTDSDFYIGRGSVFGNPYTSKPLINTLAEYQTSSREVAINTYAIYLHRKMASENKDMMDGLNEMLEKLKEGDINLVCYCAPKECHGDIIKNKLLSMLIKDLMPK